MKIQVPMLDKFEFEGWTCYPQFYSHHFAGGQWLYVDMYKGDKVMPSAILEVKYLPSHKKLEINIPFEFFDSFEGIGSVKIEKIGGFYYRYTSGRVTVEEIGDAAYLDFPESDKKVGFV